MNRVRRLLFASPLLLAAVCSACQYTFPAPGANNQSKPPLSSPQANPPKPAAPAAPAQAGSASAPVAGQPGAQPIAGAAGAGTTQNPQGLPNQAGQVPTIHVDLGHGPGASSGAALTPEIQAALAARPALAPALLPLEWFQGQWVSSSQGKGGVAQYRVESYGPIVGSVMLGTYLEVEAGEPKLYELISIESTTAGVDLCMRHFGPGLVPWKAEAAGARRYRLVRSSTEEAAFERVQDYAGQTVDSEHARLIYRRIGDRLTVRVENLDQTGGLDFSFQRLP